MSGIQWTNETWNPLVGCSKQSAGCKNCYAIGAAASVLRRLDATAKSERGRATVEAYREALDLTGRKARWSGRAVPMPHQLSKPLGWRKPRRVFVNSMSDLFHPSVGDDFIAAVFGVMAACPQHTFQVLTKHTDRAEQWFRWVAAQDAAEHMPGPACARLHCCWAALAHEYQDVGDGGPLHTKHAADPDGPWPLPNVWLGVSVEDQDSADERIPHLLECPAAVRWVSYEPALGPVWFRRGLDYNWLNPVQPTLGPARRSLDWIVVGGESGPGARPFDVQWARDTIRQCREAGVAVFVKQLGARPFDDLNHPGSEFATMGWLRLRDRKGGDMSEWPADLRVREYPGGAA